MAIGWQFFLIFILASFLANENDTSENPSFPSDHPQVLGKFFLDGLFVRRMFRTG